MDSGFITYRIVAVRPRVVAKTTLIRVVEGNMNAIQVRMEMERLV
jgi:hemolysin activation/secretion protein